MPCKDVCRIVAGYHHGAVDKVDYPELLIVYEFHNRAVGIVSCAYVYHLIEVFAHFQRQYAGHYLGGAGGVCFVPGGFFV